MKRFLVTVAASVIMAALSFAQDRQGTLPDAVTMFSQGQYTQAEKILDELSVQEPGNDAVWYYLGRVYMALSSLDKAETCISKAASIDPSNYWYRYYQARLILGKDRSEERLGAYEALVKDFPDREDLSYELLNMYMEARLYDKALDCIADIERTKGPSEALLQTRFRILSDQGKHQEAIDALEAFNAEYSSPSILTLAGDQYLADFSDSLALARYSEALELDSTYVPALLGKSEVFRHQRRYPEYFATLEHFMGAADVPASSKGLYLKTVLQSIDPKIIQNHRAGYDSLAILAVRTHPTDSTVLSDVGAYYYSTGRKEDAGLMFRIVADIYPSSKGHTVTYLQYLALMEKWDDLKVRSVAAFNRFREIAFLDYANIANFRLKDFDAIIGNCRYVINNSGGNKTLELGAWSMMGDAYHEKGDGKQAFKAYDKALKLDSSYAPVLNNYAYYLSLEGKNLKKAYNMSKKTVEAEPDNSTYLDTFAWILHLQGRDIEAKPFFKHAMLYGGKDSAVILDHYAEVLYSLGEYDLAKTYWNQASAKNAAAEIPGFEQRVKERLGKAGK